MFWIFLATIPTDLEQATGVERKELEAILGGDPVSIQRQIIETFIMSQRQNI